MKRDRYGSCILNRNTSFVVVAVLTGALCLSSSACDFDTRTYLCENKGVRCDVGQTCMPNEPEGICVDVGGCGDGHEDPDEQCDDGNLTNTDDCKTDCTRPICGDGIKSDNEECDPGNMIGCGICLFSCQRKLNLMNATGLIDMFFVNGSNEIEEVIVADQDTLTLNDGINNVTIFKFVKETGVRDGAHVIIDIPNSKPLPMATDRIPATQILGALVGKINNAYVNTLDTLLIEAFYNQGERYLFLGHQRGTALGNQKIVSSITSFNTQMANGVGADCSVGVGCASNGDCMSNVCSLNSLNSHICEKCKSNADCPSSLSCLSEGICGRCESNADCLSPLSCLSEGVCGQCGPTNNCLSPLECRSDGSCGMM